MPRFAHILCPARPSGIPPRLPSPNVQPVGSQVASPKPKINIRSGPTWLHQGQVLLQLVHQQPHYLLLLHLSPLKTRENKLLVLQRKESELLRANKSFSRYNLVVWWRIQGEGYSVITPTLWIRRLVVSIIFQGIEELYSNLPHQLVLLLHFMNDIVGLISSCIFFFLKGNHLLESLYGDGFSSISFFWLSVLLMG